MEIQKFRDTVIVAGHPRSGTSLVCQLLKSAGVTFPSDIESDSFNPDGYFELLEEKELEKRLLREAMTPENARAMNNVIRRLNNVEGRAGLKIVRMAAVFFYQHLAGPAPIVYVFRHPAEVKASLFRRGISFFQPDWIENNNALIAGLENFSQSILVSYDSILRKDQSVVRKFKQLGFEIDLDCVSTQLHTQRESRVYLTREEKELYQFLLELERQPS